MNARCAHCLDTGHVCEDHPGYPWEYMAGPVEGHAGHGGVGQPCGYCCSEIPQDGTTSITWAFTPDWQRPPGVPGSPESDRSTAPTQPPGVSGGR